MLRVGAIDLLVRRPAASRCTFAEDRRDAPILIEDDARIVGEAARRFLPLAGEDIRQIGVVADLDEFQLRIHGPDLRFRGERDLIRAHQIAIGGLQFLRTVGIQIDIALDADREMQRIDLIEARPRLVHDRLRLRVRRRPGALGGVRRRAADKGAARRTQRGAGRDDRRAYCQPMASASRGSPSAEWRLRSRAGGLVAETVATAVARAGAGAFAVGVAFLPPHAASSRAPPRAP